MHAQSPEITVTAPPLAWPHSARCSSRSRPDARSRPYVCRGCTASQLGGCSGLVPSELRTPRWTYGFNATRRNGGSRKAVAKEVRVLLNSLQTAPTFKLLYRALPARAPAFFLSVSQRPTMTTNPTHALGASPARPNPSLKLTRYGRHCKPGLRYSVHCLSPGLQYLPPRAA